MKKLILLALLFCSSYPAFPQLTIDDCYVKARANYPLIKQYDLIRESKEYNLSNAGKGYLPQISFSAKASYQSDVTQLPFDFEQLGIPGLDIPTLSKDQYGAGLEINQVIWDGGAIQSKKEEIHTRSGVEEKSLEVDLYALNERVNQVFFGILLFEARSKQNKLYQDELKRNYTKVQSWVENGIANQADLDAIRVEQLKAIQTEAQLNHSQEAYRIILSALTGEDISSAKLLKPQTTEISTAIQRPELDLFSMQIKNLETRNKRLQAGLMPRLGVFIKGGYGRPGLNMLEDDFAAYYLAGINLSWNLSGLYTNKNDKRKIRNNIAAVETQQETFLFNTRLNISGKQSEVEQYREQLKYDDEIITLRRSIKEASETKMENGMLSGIDLMRDVNAEEQARQDKIVHEIQMLSAIYNLKFIGNN
ncbi:TolC family protein [Bacteroidales bacterium OttesenSCG-928-J19]|nr:TolC family protein [Bacteroidales bacterium OttesenSCG-928-J19]